MYYWTEGVGAGEGCVQYVKSSGIGVPSFDN